MKFESYLNGSFDEMLSVIDKDTLGKTISLSLEESIDYKHQYRVSVRAFERYSMIGDNRVSANLTLIETDDKPYLILTTTGGSQAIIFKINNIGEETFLYFFIDEILKDYIVNP